VRGITTPKSSISIFTNTKLLQTYTVNPDGTFHIILTPGDYKLVFKKESQIFSQKQVIIKNNRIEMGVIL
jgi:hypothetical protein